MTNVKMCTAMLALFVLVACGPDAETLLCTPGHTQACSCDDGSDGQSTCSSVGDSWLSCSCTGGQDAGARVDASSDDGGQGSDAGGVDVSRPDVNVMCGDAGSTEPQLLSLDAPSAARGPVRVDTVFSSTESLAVALQYNTGAGYEDATLFVAASERATVQNNACSSSATLVWDSYADVAASAQVTLRVVQQGSSIAFAIEHTINIDNTADRDRVLLAAHPSGIMEDGGASNINNKVSVLLVHTDGSGSDSMTDIEVGTGPDIIAFASSGGFAVVRNGRDGTLSFLDVNGVSVSARPVMSLEPRWASTFALAADQRSLFVITSGDSVYRLVEYELFAGVPSKRREIDLATPTGCVAVSPRGDVIAVSRAAASNDHRTLDVLKRVDLSVLGSVDYPGTLCEALEFSADGMFIASVDGMYGNLVTTFETYSGLSLRIADSESFEAPYDIAFHPDGNAALVSVLGEDAVTPCSFSGNGELTSHDAISGGLPLAAEMDIVQRGTLRGLVAVSALSSVVLVQLNNDGSAQKTQTIDTGSEYSDTVQGVAIQP